ncbi:MAG: HAD family phosphatase [Candidatus Micrarchaeota archaeon]|nr:HAD family phosphatase [Candidatus Micrarchaeota archaeon]
MPITTIVFDFGDVILTNDSVRNYGEIYEHYRISREAVGKAWESAWPKLRIGETTEDEFWSELLLEAKANMGDIGYAKEVYRRNQAPIGDMFGLLGKLKAGYRLAALTDIAKEWLEFKTRKYKLDYYFDPIISSCGSGMHKPDPRIYKLLISSLKTNPGECVFIDNKEMNLVPARELGMATILFRGQPKLEEELRGLGINF